MSKLEELLESTRGEMSILYELNQTALKARKLRAELRELDDKRLELLVELRRDYGTSFRTLSDACGLSYQRIAQLLQRLKDEENRLTDLFVHLDRPHE